jgi:isopropylmalate/homocitrate/citramalate synthase
VAAAVEAGADVINIADTVGYIGICCILAYIAVLCTV